jgi:undecaprenyl-diphosphatase
MLLGIATVPVVIAGLILKVTGLIEQMRSITVIGWAMLIFGLVLYWADQKGGLQRRAEDWNLRDAIVMGLWQAVALIPGTSRSGATITASRILGFQREDGARIAMLMSIPTIAASGACSASTSSQRRTGRQHAMVPSRLSLRSSPPMQLWR